MLRRLLARIRRFVVRAAVGLLAVAGILSGIDFVRSGVPPAWFLDAAASAGTDWRAAARFALPYVPDASSDSGVSDVVLDSDSPGLSYGSPLPAPASGLSPSSGCVPRGVPVELAAACLDGRPVWVSELDELVRLRAPGLWLGSVAPLRALRAGALRSLAAQSAPSPAAPTPSASLFPAPSSGTPVVPLPVPDDAVSGSGVSAPGAADGSPGGSRHRDLQRTPPASLPGFLLRIPVFSGLAVAGVAGLFFLYGLFRSVRDRG